MRTVLKIAWRTIWRYRRRTIISLSAVAVGLTLVIIYGGLMARLQSEAKEQLDNVGMGHVEITASGWRAHRRADENMSNPAELVRDLPAGSESGWRVVARALVSSARASEGVELQGVDWTREKTLSAHLDDVREGKLPDDARGILIGDKLAQRLKVKVGDKLRVMAQRADGEIGAELYRVRGIFHSLSPAIAQRKVYVSEASARRLLGVGEVAHQLVIQLERADDADGLAARLREKLGPRYEVLSYGELVPAMKTLEELGNKVTWFAALFIYGLVGLGILNTMLMSVLERTREFGVLRAIGTRPARVVAQVLGESFWIGTLGALVGLAAGLAITWYGSSHALMNIGGGGGGLEFAGTVMRSDVKTNFSIGDALKAASLVYVMALVTALYPAWKVARAAPARALHSS
jgi:ABC-type lipoprotein release transport system permease subunit